MVDGADLNGQTPLIMAAEKGDVDWVDYLLSSGAHVDSADRFGDTALMKASSKGHIGTVQLLLPRVRIWPSEIVTATPLS